LKTEPLIDRTRPVPPIVRLLSPFQAFQHNKASGGILLLICTAIALAWANSPWVDSYQRIWATIVTVDAGPVHLSKPLLLWVNDGLMAVFFFVVGLEIKREFLVGELASPRQAALPIAGAFGGVVVPALIYTAFNQGGEGAHGWGIPMATDIAFALGIMALLGSRVPIALTVFLAALAIADDIAAVLVIAVFYTANIHWGVLIAALGCLVALGVLNWLGTRSPLVYVLFGLALWYFVLKSGVHATVAGVLLAMFIPARTRVDPEGYVLEGRELLYRFESSCRPGSSFLENDEQQAALQAIEDLSEDVQPPLHRLEHGLHPWVSFLIMPVFAFANAGVVFRGESAPSISHPVVFGVALGLFFGKPIGIFAASWLAVRLRVAELPAGVRWSHIHGAGWLGGIGFTMALFIAGLAFGGGPLLANAKLGILMASTTAGLVGYTLLSRKPAAR
jgi:Na+:H+ antiporter, NhaA family